MKTLCICLNGHISARFDAQLMRMRSAVRMNTSSIGGLCRQTKMVVFASCQLTILFSLNRIVPWFRSPFSQTIQFPSLCNPLQGNFCLGLPSSAVCLPFPLCQLPRPLRQMCPRIAPVLALSALLMLSERVQCSCSLVSQSALSVCIAIQRQTDSLGPLRSLKPCSLALSKSSKVKTVFLPLSVKVWRWAFGDCEATVFWRWQISH